MNILLGAPFSMFISAGVAATEPEWVQAELPGITAQAYVASHQETDSSGITTYWVYLTHVKEGPAKHLNGQIFSAQLLEWTVDCKQRTGSMPTIRYSNHNMPGWYDDFALTHPVEPALPSKKQVEAVCALST
jgi:hypothetical protein